MTDALLEMLRTRSFARRPVVLASGRTSDFFIDCKQTVLTADGHLLTGRAMLAAVRALKDPVRAVAGVELGGCPLASAVALLSAQEGKALDAVYVRKTVKDHGSRRELEGDTQLARGASVVVLEDVATTGGSSLDAVEKLKRAGFTVAAVIALVDRQEGAAEAFKAAGIPFVGLYTKADFMGESS